MGNTSSIAVTNNAKANNSFPQAQANDTPEQVWQQ